jgi:hypothetical protein
MVDPRKIFTISQRAEGVLEGQMKKKIQTSRVTPPFFQRVSIRNLQQRLEPLTINASEEVEIERSDRAEAQLPNPVPLKFVKPRNCQIGID